MRKAQLFTGLLGQLGESTEGVFILESAGQPLWSAKRDNGLYLSLLRDLDTAKSIWEVFHILLKQL